MLYNMHETLIFVCLVYNAFLNLGITGYSFSRGVGTPQPPLDPRMHCVLSLTEIQYIFSVKLNDILPRAT